MKYIIVTEQKPIVIGRQGETNVTTVRFSINALFPHVKADRYGLIHQRADDYAPYPTEVEVVEEYDPNRDVNVLGGYIDWVINNADTGRVGSGTAQLTAFKGDDTVAKSLIFTTVTLNSMGVTAAPDPVALYVDKVISAGSRAMNAASDAEESAGEAAASAEAASGSASDAAGSAEAAAGSAEAAAGSAEAAAGSASDAAASATQAGLRANSAEGFRNQARTYANNAYNSATQAGVSASSAAQARTDAQSAAASAQQILDDIPDTVETELAEAKQSGEFDGEDGYSPTVTVTDIPGGHRVTITDVDGAHTFDVMDGQGGGGGTEEIFWATYNRTTNAEIEAAYQAGKAVMCNYNGRLYYLGNRYSFDVHHFFSVQRGVFDHKSITRIWILMCETDSWLETYYDVPDAATVIPAGGTTGQVLRKKSNSDYDVEWATI